MSRVATTNLALGTWTDGENPGAGSQSVDSTGLNGNFIKIDTAVGTGHTTAGAHKAHVITGENLHAGVVDGATMDYDTSSHYLKVKALGIAAAQLNTDAVETLKIKDANVTAAKLATDAVETAKIKDAQVTHAKMAADAIESDNISHDNNRTKQCFVMTFEANVLKIGGLSTVTHPNIGIPMPRAGSITRISVCSSAGVVVKDSEVYGTTHFAIDDRLSCTWSQDGGGDPIEIQPTVNGSAWNPLASCASTMTNAVITIEVEFDD
jgi:hypothetical protein